MSLLTILPIHVTLWAGLAWYSLLIHRDVIAFILIHKAFTWNVIHLSNTLKKRNNIQKSRTISDKELFAKVMKRRPILYFINKVTTHHKAGITEGYIKK